MNSIYNDSLIAELRKLTTRENVCVDKLQSICSNLKNKILNMVDESEDLLGSLRYAMHLQSELICKKEIRSKKK